MKIGHWIWIVVFLLPLASAGCKGGEQKSSAAKQYPIKGKVVAVDASKPSVKLDHEEIAGLMAAMTMDYAVEYSKLLEGIKVGDQVHGQLKVDSGNYTITQLERH